MTGFGLADRGGAERGARLRVELRSVNSRYLEVKIRQPFNVGVEHGLRKQLEARLGRGRVDLAVRLEGGSFDEAADPLAALGVEGGIEGERVSQVLAGLAALEAKGRDAGVALSPPTTLDLLKFVSASARNSGAAEAPTPPEFLTAVVDEALAGLTAMREREGAALTAELGRLYDELEAQVAGLRESLEGEGERLMIQHRERLAELLGGADVAAEAIDGERVAAEVAVLIQRGDVSEELARIASHLEQARGVLAAEASVGQGKTLDFLGQELLREVTTIGSKITSHRGSALVIAAKRTIERLREQIQNVE
ncbi:hypothetical protein PPSIR1_10205 [Plesiocystis pacifica SIR-1]|uniref:YicC family protein n=2 Tax=Plesiocystis pacifica TaxID=191768 RepID=A6GJ75_9BACT|nr:hypothetical protein PPSIR1_10205 [Plesiocystis pacifica SIR-1]